MSQANEGGSSGSKIVLIIVAIVGSLLLLGLLGCLGLGYFWMQMFSKTMASAMQMAVEMEEAEVVAQTFLDDLAANQVDAAYAATSKGFQSRQSLKEFRAFVEKNPLLKKHTSSDVFAQKTGQTVLIFQATLDGPEDSLSCTLHVVKEGEQWKVDRFTIP